MYECMTPPDHSSLLSSLQRCVLDQRFRDSTNGILSGGETGSPVSSMDLEEYTHGEGEGEAGEGERRRQEELNLFQEAKENEKVE